MSLEKKVSSDIALVAIMNFANKIRSFLFIPLIVGKLGISAYGAFAQLVVITGILSHISSAGLQGSLIRYIQDDDLNDSVLYHSTLIPALILSVLAGIMIYTLSLDLTEILLGTSTYEVVFLIGAALTPIRVVFKIDEGYFRSIMRIKTASILSTSRFYIGIIGAAIAILFFEAGISGAILAIVALECLFTVGLHIIVLNQIGWGFPSISVMERAFRYSLPMAGANLASNISTRADRLIVGSFLGSGAVGIYDVAYRISSVIMMYQQPISKTFFPEFSRLIEEGKHEVCGEYITQASRVFAILVIPSIFGLAIIGGDVVKLIASERVSAQANVLIPFLAVGIAFWGVDHLYSGVLFANKNMLLMLKIRGIAAILNVVLNILFIPVFGLFAAVTATNISYMLAGVYIFKYSNQVAPSQLNVKEIIKYSISSVIMYISVEGFVSYVSLDHFILGELIIILFMSPIIYFSLLFSMAGIDKSDMIKLRSWIKS